MKQVLSIGLIFLEGLLFKTSALADVKLVSEQIKALEISQCTSAQKKCLKLKAQSSESNMQGDINTLNEIKVEMFENGKKTKTYKSQFGYLDKTENKIVLSRNLTPAVIEETEFSLKDLRVRKWIVK